MSTKQDWSNKIFFKYLQFSVYSTKQKSLYKAVFYYELRKTSDTQRVTSKYVSVFEYRNVVYLNWKSQKLTLKRSASH